MAARSIPTLLLALCIALGWSACMDTEDAVDRPPDPDRTTPGPGGVDEGRTACASENDCAIGRFCMEGRCLLPCTSGSDCAGDERCDDESNMCRPLACEVAEDCPRNEVCDSASCVLDPALPCRPGTITCDGADVVTCSPQGAESRRSCAPDGVCGVRDGAAVCVDFECTPGEGTCLDWGVAAVCSETGALVEENCGANQFCRRGECLDQVCTPGASPRCDADGNVVACNALGSRENLVEVCPGDCSGGVCAIVGPVDGCEVGATIPCYGGNEPSIELGPCNYGTRTCGSDGRYGDCEGWVSPAVERCVDLDCPAGERTRMLAVDLGEPVRTLLASEGGLTVSTAAALQTAQLADHDIVLSSAGQAVIDVNRARQWVIEEGGVLVVYGTGATSDCALVNGWLSAFGVRFDCPGRVNGTAGSIASHPLVSGVGAAALPVSIGTRIQQLEPARWTVLYRAGGQDAAVVGELGCGKVLILAHPDLAQADTWPATEPFWRNFAGWARGR